MKNISGESNLFKIKEAEMITMCLMSRKAASNKGEK